MPYADKISFVAHFTVMPARLPKSQGLILLLDPFLLHVDHVASSSAGHSP